MSTRPPLHRTLQDFLSPLPPQRITPLRTRGLPQGEGPVLVLPGVMKDDRQTARFRDALGMIGYTPFGWEVGLNYGPTREVMDGATARLTRLVRAHGPVHLVGFSMGGLLARWLAHARPGSVRQVLTICSPFRAPLTSFWLPVKPIARQIWPHVDTEALAFMIAGAPEVPWGAIYSPIDGIVAPAACQDPAHPARCRAVPVRHRVAMRDARVVKAAADLLAAS